MKTTRRQFLKASAGAATWLAFGQAPALAQKRELTFLSWSHFVPAADDELRRLAAVFSKQASCTVRVDTMDHLSMVAKVATEAQSQTGHDMIWTADADCHLYENQLASVDDVVAKLGKQYGGWYPFMVEAHQTRSGWKGAPWFWVSVPATYNMAHYKKAGFAVPGTWDELLKQGKALKKQGNPVGIAISRCRDATSTLWSVLWSYGAKVTEADGKTPAINSDKTAQVIEWYKELFKDAMDPEVLSWDDVSNNRFMLSGKGSWTANAISPYVAALKDKMPIADDINHHVSPAGPAGTHCAPSMHGIGIWKFSKNVELAKEFISFLFQKENYDAWIVASSGFNHPALKHLADHPIWSRNPKLSMLPGEAQFAHSHGWPGKPTDAVKRLDNNYVLAEMVTKAINGMPTKRAIEWAQEQVVLAVKGKLKGG
jgi:multiple sugar transport system substrate-binding protein